MNQDASQSFLFRFSRRCGSFLMIYGSVLFLVWILNPPILDRVIPWFQAADCPAGILFALGGFGVRRLARQRRDWLGSICAALVALGGLAALCQPIFGFGIVPKEWLVVCQYGPGPNTALAFLFSGLGLLFLDSETPSGFRLGQMCSLLAAFVGLLALVGYTYRVLPLYSFGSASAMPASTALALQVLSAAALAARPGSGVMRVLTSDTTGGAMARRLLPAAIMVPLVLGFLRFTSERSGYVEVEFGFSLFAVANMVLFSGLIWWNARLLFRAEEERRRMERRSAVQYGVTRLLAESTTSSTLRGPVLSTIAATLDYDAAAWWEVDQARRFIRCEQVYSASPTSTEFAESLRTTTFARGADLPGRVWEEKRAVWVRDLGREEGFLRGANAIEAGLHGAFAFPVRFNGTLCGVIECFSRRTEEPDGELMRMLDGVGSQIGQFVERKDAEERLKATSAELARSNAELQQFAYVASHDLTEPLRMVVSYLELLNEMSGDKLGSEEREFLGYAVDGARRMQALINDLLDYTRVDARWNLDLTNCNTVLESAVGNLKVTIQETGALIEWSSLPTVKADSVQLTQVFQNLIGNAIKFRGDAPPRIRIEANRNDGEWVFRVRDNGIGIDPRNAERIFVVFQRLHTRQEYPGTGMGLAICKKIIERHGGRIWVESQPGHGATFSFTLPAKV